MNTNSYWYLGLTGISLLTLLYICLVSRKPGSFPFFVTMVGAGYMIEAVIYIFLQSYSYRPMLLPETPYYDSNMGAVVSNTFSLPVAATFLAVYPLGRGWVVLVIGLFAGIEWLFLELDIYVHHWWRIAYTCLGLAVYFPAGRYLYRRMSRPLEGLFHFVVQFLSTGAVIATLHVIPIMIFLSRTYSPGWFTDSEHDTTAFATVVYLFASLIYIGLASLPRLHLVWRMVLGVALMSACHLLLARIGLLHIHVWWDPYVYMALAAGGVLVAWSLGRTLSKVPMWGGK